MDRDPRWGRTDEAFGEDPYLASAMSDAFVDGYQGETLSGQPMTPYLKVAATAKHFALNNEEDDRLSRQLGHHGRQHPRLLHQAVPEPGGERARVRHHDVLQRGQRDAVPGGHLHGRRAAAAHLRVRRLHDLGLRRGGDRVPGAAGRARLGAARLDVLGLGRPGHLDEQHHRRHDPRGRGRRGLRTAGGHPARLHRRRGDGDQHRGRDQRGPAVGGRARQRPDPAVHDADGDRRVRPGEQGRLHQHHQERDPEPGAPGAGRAGRRQRPRPAQERRRHRHQPAAAPCRPGEG